MRVYKLTFSRLILILSITMTAREPAVVDLTEGNPSQQHQDWTENGATTPPAPFRCPICLLDILPEGSHQNMPYQWPSCQRPIHLGCLLHLMTRRSCPTCPTCREPWSPDTNLQLGQLPRNAGATGIEMANSFRPMPGDCPVKQSENLRLLRFKKEREKKTFS